MPDACREELATRRKLAIAGWGVAAFLLLLFGYWTGVEVAVASAYERGALVTQRADVIDEEIGSGYNGSSDWYSQHVRIQLADGCVVSFHRSGDILEIEVGEQVSVGLWRSHLVTVNGNDVRDPWQPGSFLVFPVLPAAFVLATIQSCRLLRLVRTRRALGFNNANSSAGYVLASAGVAFLSGLILAQVDVVWWPIPVFAVSVLPHLVWFFVTETRRTMFPAAGDSS